MKHIRINQDDVNKAFNHTYLHPMQERKYPLMKVEKFRNDNSYLVIDPDEEKKLLRALKEDNPTLTEEENKKMLES
jgi:hypothetical protein